MHVDHGGRHRFTRLCCEQCFAWHRSLLNRLLLQDRGARQRRRQRVELQVLSNPSVHHASRRKSAKQSQTARDATGWVSEFRASRAGSLQHDVGHDARLVCSRDHLLQLLTQGRPNLAILIELGVGFQQVRVELRLRVRRLDDRDPDAHRA